MPSTVALEGWGFSGYPVDGQSGTAVAVRPQPYVGARRPTGLLWVRWQQVAPDLALDSGTAAPKTT